MPLERSTSQPVLSNGETSAVQLTSILRSVPCPPFLSPPRHPWVHHRSYQARQVGGDPE